MPKKKKVRADFRKNRSSRTHPTDWTRQFEKHSFEHKDTLGGERISGKGELTRRRTVVAADAPSQRSAGFDVHLDVAARGCLPGRVSRRQRWLGSSAMRIQLDSRFSANAVMTINRPGQNASHQAVVR